MKSQIENNDRKSKDSSWDDNIDSLLTFEELKPITTGLGFHRNTKSNVGDISLKQKSELLKKDFEQKSSTIQEGTTIDRGDLSPFYQNNNSTANTSINKNLREDKFSKEKAKNYKNDFQTSYDKEFKNKNESTSIGLINQEAHLLFRFFAYLLDLIVVSALVLAAFSLILFVTHIPLQDIINLENVDKLIMISPVYLLFYLFYFSIMDKLSFASIGKRIFRLKVVNIKDQNDEINITTTFLRTFISLLSVIGLCIPLLLRWQDRLTDTKIIKY